MKQRLLVLLTLVLCAAFLVPAAPAVAQGGGDCSSPFDEHGRLPSDITDNWEDGDPYQECLQCVNVPGLGAVGIFLTDIF